MNSQAIQERVLRGTYEVRNSIFRVWEYFRTGGHSYFRIQVDDLMVSPDFETMKGAEALIREFEKE